MVLGADGTRELSQRVVNGEHALLELISDVLELSGGEPVKWAIDLTPARLRGPDGSTPSPPARNRVDVDALLILPDGCVARALPVPTGQDLDATTPVRALGTWLGSPA